MRPFGASRGCIRRAAPALRSNPLRSNLLFRRQLDVPDEAEPGQDADDDVRAIELSSQQAVPGGGGEGVVVVVPAIAEREHRDPEIVPTVVARIERARAPQVTHGVDAGGDLA